MDATAQRSRRPVRTTSGSLTEGRRTWILVGAITAFAAVLRLPTLGLQSYGFDESWTLIVIRNPFGEMIHGVATYESTPPLYYVLAWVWSHAFGTGEVWLRLLSGLAMVATVPISYAVGKTLGSRRIGLVVAAIVATNPYLAYYAQEARSYALFTLLATIGVLCCARTIQDSRPRMFVLWAGVSIAAVATHYFALFPWLGEVVVLAVFGAQRRLLTWSTAVVGLAAIPLLALARHQATSGRANWIGEADLLQRIRVTVEQFALGGTFGGTLPHSVLVACGVLSIVMGSAIVAAIVLLIRRAVADERRAAAIAGLIAAVAIGIPLIAALGPRDYFVAKNVIPVIPLLAVVLGAGLGSQRAGRLGIAATGALVLSGIVLTLMSFALPSMRRPDLRRVSEQLGPPTQDRVLVFVPRWRELIEHYQGSITDLPPSGRRVSEVEVFARGAIPAGTVPRSFHLTQVQRGTTFTLYSFRSKTPRTVTPDVLARRPFDESGYQPLAVFQTPRPTSR